MPEERRRRPGDIIALMRIFRVIVPVSNIEAAVNFYSQLLAMPGERVSNGRHYFNCDGVILACFDPRADGDDFDAKPNPDHIYISTGDLESVFERAKSLGHASSEVKTQPWGERSFYITDPFGNPLCFVDSKTEFLGTQ